MSNENINTNESRSTGAAPIPLQSDPPAWMFKHPAVRMEEIDGRIEFAFVKGCETCHESMHLCRCKEPKETERLIYNRGGGVNDKLIATLKNRAVKAASASTIVEAAPAAVSPQKSIMPVETTIIEGPVATAAPAPAEDNSIARAMRDPETQRVLRECQERLKKQAIKREKEDAERQAAATAAEPVVVPKFAENEIVYHLTRGEGRVVSATVDNVRVHFATPDENDEHEDWVAPDELLTKPENEAQAPPAPQATKAPKSLLSYALACVRHGWFVFPCYPQTKKPAGEVVPNGVLQASNDENQVGAWWEKNPNYNPAIALGPSNLVVYDFDEIKPSESLPPTFTVRTGRLPKDGIEGIQMYYTGSTKTHGHPGGGGEVRSRGAYVLAPGAIHPSGNAYTIISNIPLAASPEQNEEVVVPTDPPIGTGEQETIAAYVEAGFDASGIDYRSRVAYQDGFKWLIICPWKNDHSEGNDFDTSSAVIMWPSGKLIYECKHKHCLDVRQWEQLRDWMQTKLGCVLAFGDPQDELSLPVVTVEEYRMEVKEAEATHEAEVPVVTLATTPFALGAHLGLGGDDDATTIPTFDVGVVNGIYKKVADVVCKNTTLAPQYVYSITKTLVGALMAGRIKFKELSAEPRTFLALIGETGAGKGESYRRTWAALNPPSFLETLRIKMTESADSGAGIKDLFFEAPADQPMCIYIDEIASMGDKSSKTRNPDILNTIFELKDGTRVSRVKAGLSKTKNDARLVVIMCGQNKSVFSEALVGRTETGGYDRLTPEYGVPQETGDLPEISGAEMAKLRMAFEELVYANHSDCDNTMSFDEDVKVNLDEYWETLPLPVRRKARWKQGLMVDCYLSAFGEGRMVVEQGDMDIATKIFERQLVIRQVFFGMTAPDRVGYYIRRVKDLLEKMMQMLQAGMPEEHVALSRVNFATKTGAYKKNEEGWFHKAWGLCDGYVREIEFKNSRGQKYKKYLPNPRTRSSW